jgi:hypothetical protein
MFTEIIIIYIVLNFCCLEFYFKAKWDIDTILIINVHIIAIILFFCIFGIGFEELFDVLMKRKTIVDLLIR